jgi:uncharacterized protein (TIGR02594 family)
MKSINQIFRQMIVNADLLSAGLDWYGESEYPGAKSNPRILSMLKDEGVNWTEDDSKVAWCSIWLNHICRKGRFERSGSYTARSWLEVGEEVKTPMIGDIVVFWRGRPDSWMGHVGIYIREDEDLIWVLGGNQENRVGINAYPKRRLLQYRRIKSI